PAVFEPYQSIQADHPGLTKFLKDLFVTGALTKGEVLNADVGKVSSDDGALANDIARELAEKFAAARVDEQLYERRLVISVKYATAGKLDAENSIIEGNESGMNLLGFRYMPGMRWADVRDVLVTSAEWPVELEQAMATVACGQLPPPLSPFRSPNGIFIPVIVRAEIVDRVLRHVFVIFVPADAERLGALFEGSSLPMGMPSRLKSLVHFLRLMCRVRWDILEPRRAEVMHRRPSVERCAEIVRLVLFEYDEVRSDLANLHLSSEDEFRDMFDEELWDEIDACIREWLPLNDQLRTKSPANSDELSVTFAGLRANNAKWINIGAKQFTKAVARYCESEVETA